MTVLALPRPTGVVAKAFGEDRVGGDGVVRGDTLSDGGGYVRDCVGGAWMVCAALSPTLHSQGSSHD